MRADLQYVGQNGIEIKFALATWSLCIAAVSPSSWSLLNPEKRARFLHCIGSIDFTTAIGNVLWRNAVLREEANDVSLPQHSKLRHFG
jgi:hypothetical protein